MTSALSRCVQLPARQHKPLPSPSTEDVLKSFNTWSFKREQPGNPQLLRRVVEHACREPTPLPFTLYWGKGPRDLAAQPEVQCLDYLAQMAARIGTVHAAGAQMHLVFTDTHARLNGHSEARIERYVTSVEHLALPHGFRCHRLSALCAPFMATPPPLVPMPAAIRSQLERCAEKWFRGEGSPREGAQRYFDLNMIEKRAMAAAFPQAVFITFNNSEFSSLFPDDMPIFYMHSLRRGTAVKPWFIDVPPASTPSAA
jgi:hypothetical protein